MLVGTKLALNTSSLYGPEPGPDRAAAGTETRFVKRLCIALVFKLTWYTVGPLWHGTVSILQL